MTRTVHNRSAVRPADHTSYLERLRLRAELALSLAPTVAGVVDEPHDRGILVRDAVACWLALPGSAHEHYRAAEQGTFTALELFGYDYVALAEQAVHDTLPDPAPLAADLDELVRAAWLTHIHTVGHRLTTATPPPAAWLNKFREPGSQPL